MLFLNKAMATEITVDLSPEMSTEEPARTTHNMFIGDGRPLSNPKEVTAGDLIVAYLPVDLTGKFQWRPDVRGEEFKVRRRAALPNRYAGTEYLAWEIEPIGEGLAELAFVRDYYDGTPDSHRLVEPLKIVPFEISEDLDGGLAI